MTTYRITKSIYSINHFIQSYTNFTALHIQCTTTHTGKKQILGNLLKEHTFSIIRIEINRK